MNLLDLQPTLSPLNYLNSIHTFRSPRPQQVSTTYPIMKYMFENPNSGKAWKKLIQTCKYFFSKNPIYPVKCLKYDYCNKKWKADAEIYDPIKNVAKLWIHDEINSLACAPTFLSSSLIPKINKCNVRFLDIWNQNLTFDEYSFLTSSGDLKRLHLYECIICHSDGILVKFDRLFTNIHKLEYFCMKCASNSSSMFKKDTFKKLAQIFKSFKKLSRFNLDGLTEAFDFASITDFLLKNERMLICLNYDVQLSDAYKQIFQSFYGEVFETRPKRIPEIKIHGSKSNVYYDDYQKKLNFTKTLFDMHIYHL